jgi:predicted phosphodiesterase
LAERPAAIVFLGDLEPQRPLLQEYQTFLDAAVECWHIHGNHDTDRKETWQNMLDAQERNLHGRVVTIAGIRVAGLGGIFRGEVWYPREGNERPLAKNHAEYERDLRRAPGVRRRVSKMDRIQAAAIPDRVSELVNSTLAGRLIRHNSTIFPDAIKALSRQRADVLVCHEAPSSHPHGFRAIDDLARALGVSTVFHGHHHKDLSYPDSGVGYHGYSVGLRGIRDFYGRVIRQAEFY